MNLCHISSSMVARSLSDRQQCISQWSDAHLRMRILCSSPSLAAAWAGDGGGPSDQVCR